MRKVNVSAPYSRYHGERTERQYNAVTKPLHQEIRESHLYVTPGCMMHNHPRRERVFDRHVSRGNKTNMLYWRLHKDEYAALQVKFSN